MFQLLFKYPSSIFSKGEFVLLGGWPKWVLLLLVLVLTNGKGFFSQFNSALRSPVAPAAPTGTTGATAQSVSASAAPLALASSTPSVSALGSMY